jgi:LysM repeat protein
MLHMPVTFLRYGGLLVALTSAAWAQPTADSMRMELASLREDVRLLTQRVGELTLTVEQLNRDNSSLQAKTSQSFVTLEQLNKSLADVNRTLQSALADQKREVLQQVAVQIERLGRQTNAALDALAKNQATRPAVQTTFTEDFPKEGINYTVQSGDTLSGIAKKTGAKLQDIRNANKIADDTKIRVGQTLFIPQGK